MYKSLKVSLTILHTSKHIHRKFSYWNRIILDLLVVLSKSMDSVSSINGEEMITAEATFSERYTNENAMK